MNYTRGRREIRKTKDNEHVTDGTNHKTKEDQNLSIPISEKLLNHYIKTANFNQAKPAIEETFGNKKNLCSTQKK